MRRLADLQARYRVAADAERAWDVEQSVKYGNTTAARAYGKRAEQDKTDRLRRAVSKASDAILAWLAANSPWDWQSGTSVWWICYELSEEQATATVAPILPAKARAYGYPHADYQPESRVLTSQDNGQEVGNVNA